jgi:hypothetical protein
MHSQKTPIDLQAITINLPYFTLKLTLHQMFFSLNLRIKRGAVPLRLYFTIKNYIKA